MQVYYDKDCDLSIIQGKKVAVIGYGSQGHAHACNLKDSGVDVTVGLRPSSSSVAKAEAHGLKVADVPSAVAAADLVIEAEGDQAPVFYESMPAGEAGNRRAEIFLE